MTGADALGAGWPGPGAPELPQPAASSAAAVTPASTRHEFLMPVRRASDGRGCMARPFLHEVLHPDPGRYRGQRPVTFIT
jgi:hypothetical protein